MANAPEVRSAKWVSHTIFVIILIFVLNYLAYGLFFVPALYSDDWNHAIYRVITESATWFNVANRRPLLFAPFLFQYRLFGINITAYYIILWCLHIGIAVMVFVIANSFEVLRRYYFSSIFALLFLVYPTNYAGMWLTMVLVYCAVALVLLCGYFLLRFARGGPWPTLLFSLICLMLSFGFYEGQLGLVCAWSLLLVFTSRQLPVMKRFGLLSPIMLGGGFALWRTLGQQTIGVVDHYLSQITITPGILMSRFLLGYKINLLWGWTTTVQYLFPLLSNNKYALLFLVIMVLAVWWLLRNLPRPLKGRASTMTAWRLKYRWVGMRSYTFLGLVGLFLVGAGYVPVVAAFLPNLSGNGGASRYNLFASFGGAFSMLCILMVGAFFFARTRQQAKHLFLASSVLFLMLGGITQAFVQYENRIAWQEQKAIWQELFSIAPNLRNNTNVIFILPGFKDRVGYQNWRRTPLYAFWDVSDALRILYNDSSLSGDIIYPDLSLDVEPTLTAQGVANFESGMITPYAQTLAFVYDHSNNTLKQLDRLPLQLTDWTSSPVELCNDCILERSSKFPLRRLVQD